MKYILITGGTSGIGRAISEYFLSQGYSSIITGSRTSFECDENEYYIKHDQRIDSHLALKVKGLTHAVEYVFLNAGVFYPDTADQHLLDEMTMVNYLSARDILHDLNESGMLSHSRVVLNASIQAQFPRVHALHYAETKRKIVEESFVYAKQKNLNLTALGLSCVYDTPMLDKFIEICIRAGSHTSKESFYEFTETTSVGDVVTLISRIFGLNEVDYQKQYKSQFIVL